MLIRLPFLAGAAATLLAASVASSPVAAQNRSEPLARFFDPVCPAVSGLRVEAAAAIVGRFRANAEAAGVPVAAMDDCRPNVLIVIVDDGRAYLRQLQADRPYIFQEMDFARRGALLRSDGPAWAVLRTREYSRDGSPIGRQDNLIDVPQTSMWMAHSRIYTATRKDIHSALILFDLDAVDGLTYAQLADYATMRALSQTFPQERQGASIVRLFDTGEEPVEELSPLDRTYLETLYRGQANLPGNTRLAELGKATERAITE